MTYEPYCGGAEVAIREICDRLDPRDYQFDLIALRVDERLPKFERVGNVNVYRLGAVVSPEAIVGKGNELHIIPDNDLPLKIKLAKILYPLQAFWLARKLHQTHSYQIAWAMMSGHAGIAGTLFTWWYPSVMYFLELQDGKSLAGLKERLPWLSLVWGWYEKVYTRAKLIKAISNYIADLAREAGYQGEVVLIPNAVNVKKFSAPQSPEKLTELKVRFQKQPDEVFLFTASRLVLSRGVEEVIRALPLLPPHIKFLVAGAGEGLEPLKQIAEDAGVTERVLWAGQISHDELPAYLQISDVFVRASLFEGLGNAFLEAMAAGIPVICTPVGGIPDFLADPREGAEIPTGLFCQVKDPESLARAVEYLLAQPALRQLMIKNAQTLVREQYEWDMVARAMKERVFDKLAK